MGGEQQVIAWIGLLLLGAVVYAQRSKLAALFGGNTTPIASLLVTGAGQALSGANNAVVSAATSAATSTAKSAATSVTNIGWDLTPLGLLGVKKP